MADEKKNEEKEEEKRQKEEAEKQETEGTPDPGYPATKPKTLEPTEEEAEQAQKEKEEAEEAARKAAEDQPEDPSVEEKQRAEVRVLKAQFEREWPTVQSQFPGVEPKFGKEKDGYVELLNVQAPAMAHATASTQSVEVTMTPQRTQHGWDDFRDMSLPASIQGQDTDDDDDDIEAQPKRRKQQKVSTRS